MLRFFRLAFVLCLILVKQFAAGELGLTDEIRLSGNYTENDTIRKVIISEILYEQITDDLEKSESTTSKYDPLKSIQLNDTLSIDTFIKALKVLPGSKLYRVADSLFFGPGKTQEDSVVLTRAHISAINRELDDRYRKYNFYHVLNNARENDKIPFRYIQYLMDFEDYKLEVVLREQVIEKYPVKKTSDEISEKEAKPGKQVIAEKKSEPEEQVIAEKEQAQPPVKTPPENMAETRDIIFRVQIAASRVPLTHEKLNSIYPGKKEIIKNFGDGWHRYSIGICSSFEQATRLKNAIDVNGAFEVAYKGNQRLNAYKLKEEYSQCSRIQITNSLPAKPEFIFKVQVAASKTKISQTELAQIYCGNLSVYEVFEDPWYRYSIGNFEDYSEALRLRDRICTPGAFVVAYKNGSKIPVRRAMK